MSAPNVIRNLLLDRLSEILPVDPAERISGVEIIGKIRAERWPLPIGDASLQCILSQLAQTLSSPIKRLPGGHGYYLRPQSERMSEFTVADAEAIRERAQQALVEERGKAECAYELARWIMNPDHMPEYQRWSRVISTCHKLSRIDPAAYDAAVAPKQEGEG